MRLPWLAASLACILLAFQGLDGLHSVHGLEDGAFETDGGIDATYPSVVDDSPAVSTGGRSVASTPTKVHQEHPTEATNHFRMKCKELQQNYLNTIAAEKEKHQEELATERTKHAALHKESKLKKMKHRKKYAALSNERDGKAKAVRSLPPWLREHITKALYSSKECVSSEKGCEPAYTGMQSQGVPMPVQLGNANTEASGTSTPYCHKHQVKYSGGALTTGEEVSSAEACQSLCQDHTSCAFFSLEWDTTHSPTQSPSDLEPGCYVKTNCPGQSSFTATEYTRDTWGEENVNAANDEDVCLTDRKLNYDEWCGVTSTMMRWIPPADSSPPETVQAGAGTCTLHDVSAVQEDAPGHVAGPAMKTGSDVGATARLKRVDCASQPGTIDLPFSQEECFTDEGYIRGSDLSDGTPKCQEYFAGEVGASFTCPDGGILSTGVGITYSSGTTDYILCAAWDSAALVRGFMGCSADGSMCTKAKVSKEHGMSESAGVLLLKRYHCTDDGACSVFKTGRCFDVGENVFTEGLWTDGANYDAATLEIHLRTFATKVVEGLQSGLVMNCSTVPHLLEMPHLIDAQLAEAAVKGY